MPPEQQDGEQEPRPWEQRLRDALLEAARARHDRRRCTRPRSAAGEAHA